MYNSVVMVRVLVQIKIAKTPREVMFKKIEKYETDEEVFANRLAMRYYFRDLFRNQEMLKGVKAYFG